MAFWYGRGWIQVLKRLQNPPTLMSPMLASPSDRPPQSGAVIIASGSGLVFRQLNTPPLVLAGTWD